MRFKRMRSEVYMTPFEKYGKLHVAGKNLTDASGNTVVLKGISTHNLNEYPQYVNKEAFKQFRDEYGVSIMRLAMYSAFADNHEGYSDSNDEHRAELEELILKGASICRELGIYCMIDWHILFDYDPNMHTDMAIGFFKNTIHTPSVLCVVGEISATQQRKYAIYPLRSDIHVSPLVEKPNTPRSQYLRDR